MAGSRNMIDVRGVRRLQRQLRRLGADVDEVKTEAAKRWAQHVEADAKANVEVDTGRLRRRITSRWDANSAVVGVWADDAYYSAFVEHGTSAMPARPFLLPAAVRAPDPALFLRQEIERRAQGPA